MKKMTDLDVSRHRLIIREDFNVPLEEGRITNEERIDRALPTIQLALHKGAKVMLMSHLGRPEEGKFDPAFSLAPIADLLEKKLEKPVPLVEIFSLLSDQKSAKAFYQLERKNLLSWETAQQEKIILVENVRFLKGENKNDPRLSKKIADLCDIFVMDAFATAHRAQASTYGIAEFAPVACAGPLLIEEMQALSKALKNPKKPLLAIIGGSKVSTKIQLLENLLQKVNVLIVGGGMANTFLAAQGFPMGKSLYEPDWIESAKQWIELAKQKNVTLLLPQDVRVGKVFAKEESAKIKSLSEVCENDMILDIGPATEKNYEIVIQKAGTVLWNGPLGVFEFPNFASGTQKVGKAITCSHAFSLAGGGDTVAALEKFGLRDKISYVSTGGGAFLEYLEGQTLPALTILEKRAKK